MCHSIEGLSFEKREKGYSHSSTSNKLPISLSEELNATSGLNNYTIWFFQRNEEV